jgi:hypothetical protein
MACSTGVPDQAAFHKSVRVVDIDLGDGTTKRSVTTPTPRAAAVLRALGIANRAPPTPPIGSQTLM